MKKRITAQIPEWSLVFALFVFASVSFADNQRLAERTAVVSKEVETIRELPFLEPVKTQVQSLEDFEQHVISEIRKQYGEDKGAGFIRALVRLGAIDEIVDLEELYTGLLKSQAAAYYDPRSEVYYLLTPDAETTLLDYITSHELVHALQHQHFNLYELMLADPQRWHDNMDAAYAMQCLVEGDATVVMSLWLLRSLQPVKPAVDQLMHMLRLMLRMQAEMDYETMLSMAKMSGDGMGGLGGLGDTLDDLENFPRYIVESMLSTYIHGAVMVMEVWRDGGWQAVNALYTNPPASTEQVLYPGKLRAPRDEPVDVRRAEFFEPLGGEWRQVASSVAGQLGMRIMFSMWQNPENHDEAYARAAAKDWGGDRYYLYENSTTGEELLAWFTVWDNEAAAARFAEAMTAAAQRRFPGSNRNDEDTDAQMLRIQTADNRSLLLLRNGKTVTWLDADHPRIIDALNQ